MVLESMMKNILALISTIFLIAFTNVLVNLSCSWYGCYHWTNLFNHDLVCHGCINTAKYMKDYQLMIYMSLGTLLASEIKTMMDHMNPFHLKFSLWSADETVEADKTKDSVKDSVKDSIKVVYKIPEYTLGRNSPSPRWCANSHD